MKWFTPLSIKPVLSGRDTRPSRSVMIVYVIYIKVSCKVVTTRRREPSQVPIQIVGTLGSSIFDSASLICQANKRLSFL